VNSSIYKRYSNILV